MVHEAVVVDDARLLQLGNQFSTRRPRRRCIAFRLRAAEFRQDFDRAIQNPLLLRRRQLRDVLVRVAMQSDFVPGVSNLAELLGEGFDAVGRGEPCRFDVVSVVEFQEAVDTDRSAVYPSRNVRWVLRAAVAGVDPVCYCVDVDLL